ncbi:hypothetical protein ACHHYP_05938 [Achlya hypogyna]|uniref:Uncharacterized protein n=1 Tax=Achlya hypogyna TaxID=1202772 RepID=A0A1V9YVY9_ACHHY|nr:hypothetical protein ACHHYP_05938 [Achlya hypogyna]
MEELLYQHFPTVRNFSTSTICHALRYDLRLSRKLLTKVVREALLREITNSCAVVTKIYQHLFHLLFIEETSKDARDALRKQDIIRVALKRHAHGESMVALADKLGISASVLKYHKKRYLNDQDVRV